MERPEARDPRDPARPADGPSEPPGDAGALDRLCARAARWLGASAVAVVAVGGAGARVAAASGLGDEAGSDLAEDPRCLRVARSGEPVLGGAGPGGGAAPAFLGVPLRNLPGELAGCLCALAPGPREWTGEQVELLGDFAAAAGAMLGASGPGAADGERYARLVATIPQAVYQVDSAGRFTELNPAAERILGRPAASLLGQPIGGVLSPESAAEVAGVFARVSGGTEDDIQFDLRIRRPSGEERVLSASATAVREQGRITGVYGIAHDVTDARRAEEALRRSESRYRRLVEDAPYTVYTLDREGRFTDVNSAGSTLLGYRPDELIGRSITDVIVAEDLPLAVDSIRRKLQGESDTTDLEIRMRHASGAVRLAHLRASVIREGGEIVGTHGIGRDITEERAIALALSESEARLRQIAETVREVLWIFTPDFSQTLYASPAYEEIWRRPLEELYRDPRSFLAPVHPDDLPALIEAMSLIPRERVTGVEYRIVREDGEVRWLLSRGYPVYDAEGQVHRVVGTTEDITERKQAEATLRESEARLRQILNALPVGTLLTDAGGRIIWHNAASERIWGGIRYVGPSEYDVYRGWWADTDRRLTAGDWGAARALDGHETAGELVDIERFDGARRSILSSAAPARSESGEITGVVWAMQDVTEARAVERQRRLLAAALEGLQEGIAMMSAEGELLYANAAYARMLGIDRAQIPGLRISAFAPDAEIRRQQEHHLRTAAERGRWSGRI